MSDLKVDANELRGASGAVSGLGGGLPGTGAGEAAGAMPGSATANALNQTEAAKTHAQSVIQARYQEMGHLLTESANSYQDSDVDAARRLSALGDLNPA